MRDKKIVCKGCGRSFIFSESEQEFYASKNFVDPVYCPECRKIRKANRTNQNGGSNMGKKTEKPNKSTKKTDTKTGKKKK